MATEEEEKTKRDERRKRWEDKEEEANERRLRIHKMEEQRWKIYVECAAVDLEYAKARLKTTVAQEAYWRLQSTHPGEHDALFQKVLTEVQLMRKDIKDAVRGRTTEDSG